MTMTDVTGFRFNQQLAGLLGEEAEIELHDGEVLQGVPMEITYPHNKSAHLMFEAAHGEYLCLDLRDIGSVRHLANHPSLGTSISAF